MDNICKKRHRYLSMFDQLPDAQDNQSNGRHKCVGCAYVLGLWDALNGAEMRNNLNELPKSQAGTGRHKDAMKAYLLGYQYGLYINS